MGTARFIFGIICLIGVIGYGMPDSRFLAKTGANKEQGLKSKDQGSRSKDSLLQRERITEIARSQIGVRELTGNNDGLAVEGYLKVTNLPKGNPWCAAFVSWAFAEAGFVKPRTAWSPALFPNARSTLTPKPADVLGIYSIKLKRIAHAGLVERRQHNWIISIEGNTNANGGREGDGVYRKWRHIRTIAKFADWVK